MKSFCPALGLHQGLNIAGYKLIDIDISHQSVKRYHEYKYPIRLTFDCSNEKYNNQQLESQLKSQISGDKIIYSDYGNPYNCNIEFQSIDRCQHGNIVILTLIHLLGHSYRTYIT